MELLRLDLTGFANPGKAQEMARYMKHKFAFIGLAQPIRLQHTKALIKQSKQWPNEVLLKEIVYYYQQVEREYQYLAVDLITANVARLTWDNWLQVLLPLIDQKAWWDSVDALRKPLGLWLQSRPTELEQLINQFYKANSFWLRRVAITVQLNYKQNTELTLLSKSILANAQDKEFFIQKGIGWALREYSKTNKQWVQQFLQQNQLMALSVREASKYL